MASGASFGTLVQSIAAEVYRGRRIKLAASVRTEVTGGGNQGQMWLRVDQMDGQITFFDNMDDRPIRSPEWQRFEIEGEVSEDANRIYFGCFLRGSGRVWVDDFELLSEGDDGVWEPIEISNSGFEDGDAGEEPPGWRNRGQGYRFSLTDEESRSGRFAATIEDEPIELTEDLFEAHPAVGEFVEAVIGGGLSVRVPLALYGSETETWR